MPNIIPYAIDEITNTLFCLWNINLKILIKVLEKTIYIENNF